MTDIIIESVRVVVVLCLLLYLWHAGRERFQPGRKGWHLILGGFSLLLLGSIFDVTDNFESLNRFVIIGNTETEALLEKVVGSIGGFVLLTVGLIRWAPSVQQLSIEVAARKKAEEEIAEKSALLETTFETMSQGFAVYDGDLRLTAFNQRYLDLRGYPPGFIRLGMSYDEISRFRAKRGDYGPGDIEELVKGAMGRARQRTIRERELTAPDGIVTSVFHDPLPDGGHVVTITDITERKRAEREIAEKSALLETTFESMSQGIRVLDADLNIVAFNQKFIDIWRYPPGFIRIGMALEKIVRFKVERGDYGPVDVEEHVRGRLSAKRNRRNVRREVNLSDGKVIAAYHEAMPSGGFVTTYTDITGIKRAEREIAEKSALLETTFESMSQGIVVYDADLKLVGFNQNYVDFCGYPADFIHLGMQYQDVVRARAKRGDYGPIEDIDALVRERVAARRKGEVIRRERTLADGRIIAVRRDPMPDGGYVTTFTDITEHKRAAREIAEKSALLETTFENIAHGFAVYDADDRLAAFNLKYVDLCDYPQHYVHLGMSFEELSRFRAKRGYYGPGDPGEQVRQRMESRRKGETAQRERVMPDGRVVLVRRQPMPAGGYVSTFTDITELRKAEQEIAEKSAVLERTFESISQGITVFDADLKLIAFNQRYLDIRGYPEGFFHLGQSHEKIVRFNAERGEYGPGDSEKQVRERIGNARRGTPWRTEYTRSSGTSIAAQLDPLPGGGFVTTFTDVTERKKAQEEIAEKSALLETTLESMSRGITVYDADHTLIVFNPRFVELFDFPPEFIRLGMSLEDMARFLAERGEYGPGDVEELVRERAGDMDRGEINPRERTRPNGTVILARRDAMPGGGYVTTYSDITERKRAEAALRQSEEQLSLLLRSTGEAIYGLDTEGNCTFCNPACLDLLGYDEPDDLLGTNMHDLIHHTRADGAPYPVEECHIYMAFRRGASTEVDDEVLWRRDGTSFPAEYRSFPVRKDGEVVGAVVTFNDITERKRAEAAVQESQRRFAGIVELADDAIISIDDEQRIILFNESAERTFGYEAKEVLGEPIEVLLPSRARKKHRNHVNMFAGSPDASRIMGERRDLLGRRKDGTEFPAEASVSKLETGGKQVFTVILRDISERQRAEEALRARQRRLRELQTELLNVSRQSAMGQLSSALAHELNQPLAAIMNYVQASRRTIKKAGGIVSEKAYRMMDNALDQADRAGAIMRGLRDIVEKGEAARAESDINKVVEEASALGLIGAARKGIEVDMEFGADLPPVIINEIQIQQVVMNLVRNGVEAMAASKKRDLTIKTALDHDNTIEIAIGDSGPGLAEEVEKRLFQPFVTTKAGGMGIGLSISHSIVDAHGGRLWATPNPDGGTVFHFTLPLAPNGAQDNDE